MAAEITRDIIESYLNCKYKGHLKLTGENGTISDYEALITAARSSSREQAVGRLIARFGKGDACRGTILTAATLKQGRPLLVDVRLEDDAMSLCFDALKRTVGASELGGHHYVPIFHNHADKRSKRPKLLLAILGHLLGRVQGLRPATGLVASGPEGRLAKVRLDATLYRQAEQVLGEIQRLRVGGETPRLTLNGHCPVCEFRQRCRTQAEEADDISLLGISEKELRRLQRKGISTLTQLAYTFRPRRKGKRPVRHSAHRHYALQALAIRDQRVYLFGTPPVPDPPTAIYLDLEGKPDKDFVYLLGMIIVHAGQEERFSFWADNQDEEVKIVQQMLDQIARHEDFTVFSYGGYERDFLRRVRKAARKKKPLDRVLDSLVNVLSLVHAHAYFPTYGNGLKEVAACLGFSWSAPDASGLQSIVWRERWEATHDDLWKEKLIQYNLEDCAALRRVTALLRGFKTGALAAAGTISPGDGGLPVSEVKELDKWDNNRQWGTARFAQPEFEQINRCAYFDYQRERVYVRSDKKRRKGHRTVKKRRWLKLRVTKRVLVTSRRCPWCKGSSLTTEMDRRNVQYRASHAKRAYDLVITGAGVRRKVIECRASLQRCLDCGRCFVPEAFQRLDKHFHGLKSWAMYSHIAQRISLKRIRGMIEELFGLRMSLTEINMFKGLMARYYRRAQERLLRKMLCGNLLHINETEVKLRTGKGYVWVLTNLEDVVYLYRPTREGDFLRDLLKDFKGVLVSDFYAAYDSLDCPQQKCLIHLVRDMNQELLSNPFDEEIKAITQPFGVLLRAIVATIDEHAIEAAIPGQA